MVKVVFKNKGNRKKQFSQFHTTGSFSLCFQSPLKHFCEVALRSAIFKSANVGKPALMSTENAKVKIYALHLYTPLIFFPQSSREFL